MNGKEIIPVDDAELPVPPEALTDPERFELLRLWAAHQQLHVTMCTGMDGGAEDFGEVLADLFEHASRMYAQRDGRPLEEVRQAILEDFESRIDDRKPSLDGSMPMEH
jgi:hypothetical protein